MEIPLYEMLQHLREELQTSMAVSKGESLRFRLDTVDLELQVAVTKSATGKGGVKFWVLNADGEVKRDTKEVQTIKLKLTPVDNEGDNPLLGG